MKEATAPGLAQIRQAQITMGCDELEPTMSFFVERLGFRIDAIFPADDPRTAIISGHGIGIELRRGSTDGARELSLLCEDPLAVAQGEPELVAPNGAKIRLSSIDPTLELPETRQELVVSRMAGGAPWTVGRAGLRYRDLLPQRHGGAFIASHIRIVEGGPVPDYVHFHKVRFQMIFCRKGWVRVVYEGQGDSFVMSAGDCVLQPPGIRHRVLESSPGAEVVEFASPAEHITRVEHQLELPSERLPTDHDFGGQRFVRHIASGAAWSPWRLEGFESRNTGIDLATSGAASVQVVRSTSASTGPMQRCGAEFCFYFVLQGRLTVWLEDATHELAADDSIAIPGNCLHALDSHAGMEMLEVMLPADPEA